MDASQGSSSSSDASGNERSSSSSGHLNGSSKACSSQVGAQQAHGLWQLRSVPERGEKGKRKAPDRHYAIQAVCSCNTTEPICAEITQNHWLLLPHMAKQVRVVFTWLCSARKGSTATGSSSGDEIA